MSAPCLTKISEASHEEHHPPQPFGRKRCKNNSKAAQEYVQNGSLHTNGYILIVLLYVTHTHHTYIVPYECMCACIMRLRIKLLGICIANLTLIYVAKVGWYHIFPNKISNLPHSCARSDNISVIVTFGTRSVHWQTKRGEDAYFSFIRCQPHVSMAFLELHARRTSLLSRLVENVAKQLLIYPIIILVALVCVIYTHSTLTLHSTVRVHVPPYHVPTNKATRHMYRESRM